MEVYEEISKGGKTGASHCHSEFDNCPDNNVDVVPYKIRMFSFEMTAARMVAYKMDQANSRKKART